MSDFCGTLALCAAWLCLAGPAMAADRQPADFRGEPVEHWARQLRDDNIRARWYAAYALGRIGPPAAGAAGDLLAVLKDKGQYEYVRGMAAWALGRIEVADRPVVDMLIEGLRSRYHVSVRRNAARALGNLGEPAKPAVAELLRLLGDEDETVRVNAAEALWRIDRHAGALPVLLEMLRRPSGPGPYRAAACLGRIGRSTDSAAGALVGALAHADADIRRMAAESLGRIGPSAIPHLQPAITNSDLAVRRGAVEALGRIGRPALPQLIAKLADEEPIVRMTAARSLGRLGPEAADATAALKSAVDDPDRRVREAVSKSLKSIRAAGSR